MKRMNPKSMASKKKVSTQTVKLTKASVKKTAGLSGGLIRLPRNAQPLHNVAIITGLPAGTQFISAWVTEWKPGNRPHAGDALFLTFSVQLFESGTKCRILYSMEEWSTPLPAAVQLMYG